MKYILFWAAIFLYSNFANLQAMETPTIPCYVTNETWPEKTLLTGTITYGEQHTEEISLLVDGITTECKRIEQLIKLPSGRITKINLILSHYHEESNACDIEATLASSLLFKPKAPLKGIGLELVPIEIQTHPVYNLPSKFQDK
jgi:hypothetical protein